MDTIMRAKHLSSYFLGLSVSALTLYLLTLPVNAVFHTSGPINTGHSKLSCKDCHKTAAGTLRQQLQVNVRYLAGTIERPANMGFASVGNETCDECHDRPNDDHAVYQFNEPKYAGIRGKISPQSCNYCHLEHSGVRVTVDALFCRYCHEGIDISGDTISTPHTDLIKASNWNSCMTCHDYHGNHIMKVSTDLMAAITPLRIKQYFDGSKSPYSDNKKYLAKGIKP